MDQTLKLMGIIILVLGTIIAIPFTIDYAFSQSTSTTIAAQELKQEVANNAGQADINTIVAGGGIAAVIAGIVKQVLDQRKNKKEDVGTDRDVTVGFALIGKILSYAYVMDPVWKQILDRPIDASPLNTRKTIGEGYSEFMQSYIDYTKNIINQPVPNMSIAVSTIKPVINSTQSTNITNQPPKPPAPSGNT